MCIRFAMCKLTVISICVVKANKATAAIFSDYSLAGV